MTNLFDVRHAVLAQAENNGRTIAVDCPDEQLSYATLAARSAALSSQLSSIAQGPVSGKPIAILAPRGGAHITALLAVARAGAAFMPIDPQLPPSRILAMLKQAQPLVLLSTPQNRDLAKKVAGTLPMLIIGTDESPSKDVAAVQPNSPSYLMFTSGSTGAPKGVLGRFKSLNHFIAWQIETFALHATTKTAQLAPVTFDVSLRDIFTPLAHGGTVCVPEEETAGNPRLLTRWLAEKQISLLHCVPTIFRLLTQALAAPTQETTPDLSCLSHIFLAGEPLFGRDIKAWQQVAGNSARLINLYGPSETTLAKLYHPLDPPESLDEGLLPIGRPLPDTAAFILKGDRQAAIGEIGEICIRTAYPSLGYINDPAATRAVFVRNPLGEQQNDIIYRSGDLGRTLPDGTIECLGRLDNQVKIAGNRVEGGDVEAATCRCEGVEQCAVVIDRSNTAEPFLIGYFTVKEEQPATIDRVRAHLGETLPPYMIPRFLVELKELPLLMNGKINRRALPKPDELIHGDAGPKAPQGEMEERLTRIWSTILGIDRIGVETPFAHLGGDSLKAIQVIARIHLELGRDISLANFFKTPTIRVHAQLLEQSENKAVAPIPRLPEAAHYPLSSAQRRLWALQELGMNPVAYNLTFAFLAQGDLDLKRLERAISSVVERHEILRTRFIQVNGEPRQQPVANLGLRVERTLLGGSGSFAERCAKALEKERQRPFDLTSAQLLRVIAAQGEKAEESILLLFSFHHIICDGESLAVFADELAQAYAADGALRLQPLDFQHRDVSAWQQKRLDSPEHLEKLHRFWKETLGPVPPVLDLAEAGPRPATQRFQGDTRPLRLAPSLSEELRRLAQSRQTTLFNVLLTGLLLVLERHSGQNDIVVGTPVLGRNHPLLQNQIGFFANTLVLRNQIDLAQPLTTLLNRVTETTKTALDHQELPFDQLVQLFDLPRNLSRNPICDVLLVVMDTPFSGIELPGVEIAPFGNDSEWKFSRFDLVVHVRTDNEDRALQLDLNYDSDLFTASQVDRLGLHFAQLLSLMAQSPELPVGHMDCLTAEERSFHAALDRSAEANLPTTIPQMFASAVKQNANRAAVKKGSQTLTYRQLDERARIIGTELLRRGMTREDRIAVLGARRIEGVAAILGILQAGGAYVPLDERWPQARIDQVLQLSGARWILSAAEVTSVSQKSELIQIADIKDDGGSPLAEPIPDNLAYIIFTSGSTGEPKGVMVEHAGFCNMISDQIKGFGLTSSSRVLQFAAPVFDGALSEIFMALLSGGLLVLTSQEIIEDTTAFQELLESEAITTITLPPSYLGALQAPLPPRLTTLITAGEAARHDDVNRFADTLCYINAYGPAENSVCSTFHRILKKDAQAHTIPIGKPLPGVGISLVDAQSRPVPLGVPGELILHGVGLARGYIDRPDLTEQAFGPDPSQQNRRTYRSGDFCLLNEDGSLSYVGRRDNQIKIAGQRLELADVRHVLRRAPVVEEAIVSVVGEPGAPTGVGAWVKKRPTKVSLWPSVAEFFVYDEVVYGAMATDNIRNARYLEGFRRYLPGTTVLEVGPGPFAILSHLAIEAGARHVYAVEINPEVAQQARTCVAAHQLQDRITILTGDAVETALPEKVDWCISEIVGAIGGSEGAAAIINGIRQQLTAPDQILPRASLTKIAAVELPLSVLESGFPPLAQGYIDRIFAQVGRPFDLRLCLRRLDRNSILSTSDIFEHLDYTQEMALAGKHEIELTIQRSGRVTGFVLWLTLDVGANRDIDILTGSSSWLPVYAAFSPDGLAVTKGDRLLGSVSRFPGRDGRHQDYRIDCTLQTADGSMHACRIDLPHISDTFRATPLHHHLFAEDGTSNRIEDTFLDDVRNYAANHLPRFATPRLLREIETIPLTVNGKIAFAELPSLLLPAMTDRSLEYSPLEGTAEVIGTVFRELLHLEQIDTDTSFFASGGDSIAAIKAVARLQDLGIRLTVAEIFRYQSIGELARIARTTKTTGYNSWSGAASLAPIQQWFLHHYGLPAGNHFNQSLLLKLAQPVSKETLTAAVARLLEQHDVLRGHLHPNAETPFFDIPEKLETSIVSFHDLRGQDRLTADNEAVRLANATHRGFDLLHPPLLRGLHFSRDDGESLLLVAHHMVMDIVSWTILLSDLEKILTEPACTLPPRTAPYGEITAALAREAESPVTTTELPYWREIARSIAICALPRAKNGDNRVRVHRLDLDPAATSVLLKSAGNAPGGPQAILLRAIASAAAEAFGWPGAPVAVETNGRELPTTIPPCERTVGWFTQIVPVWVPAGQPHDPMADLPRNGVGFGLLTWMRSDHPELRSSVAPIALNFLGQLNSPHPQNVPTDTPFTVDWNGLGEPLSSAATPQHPIAILAHFDDDGMFISVTIDYGVLEKEAAGIFVDTFSQELQTARVLPGEDEEIDMEMLAASLGISG